jgi:hypothetical protein
MVYMGIRRWLCPDHRFRRSRIPFDGNQKWGEASRCPTSEDIRAMGEERAEFLHNGGVEDLQQDPIKEHGVKRVPSLYQLPCWAVSKYVSHKKVGFV